MYEYLAGELSVVAVMEVLHDEVWDMVKPLTVTMSPFAVHSKQKELFKPW